MLKPLFSLLAALPLLAQSAHTIEATAVLRDYSHPKHAGDFHEERVQLTIAADSERKALVATFVDGQGATDRFVLRGSQLFAAKSPTELEPSNGAGDLRKLTLARLDPLFVRESLGSANTLAFGDELWRVRVDGEGNPESIETSFTHDLYGDLVEVVKYERWTDHGGLRFPSRITVHEGPRLKATVDVRSVRKGADDEVLRASRAHPHAVYDEDISFREIAPRVHAIELKPANMRVFVAEFEDHVFVIEGAYDDRNTARIARRIQQRFPSKPIRYFSFSHIHGQYVGGVRSYVAAGATVITTPTGGDVVKEIVKATTALVPKSRTFEDATNAMTVFNVDSQHTDDYFVFYFPRAKLLLAGDLLCYRGPTTPLRARSKHLCETIKSLGIEVEQMTTTWPLEGYGCISPVSFEDFQKACAVQ